MSLPSRRDLLLGAGAALAMPRVGPLRSLVQDRAWIPSDRFLAGLPRIMDLASVPGLGISVVEDARPVWTRVVGVANADTGEPLTDDAVFPAASLGKPVFAYVVLKLVDEGRIDLDRPLVAYHRPDDLADDPRVERITARHVLSHATGLPNWRNTAGARLGPSFEPGDRFQYSGEGFYWLQRVVETVTGQGVDRAMEERLFRPAGMARATYAWSADHQRWTVYGHTSRGAVGRQFTRLMGDPLLPLAERWGKPIRDWTSADTFRAMEETGSTLPRLPNFALPNVAGGLLLTAQGYARFTALMMAGRTRAPWEIREDTRAAMLRPVSTLKPGLAWGLGWGLEEGPRGPLFWHWGDNGIFRAFVLGDAARRRAIVVFTNAEGGPKVYQRIIADAAGFDPGAFLWV